MLFAVPAIAENTYTPGTYTAAADGIGKVTVNATFDETSITDVQIDLSNETPNIGMVIGDEMAGKILEAQSGNVDVVSQATVTSKSWQRKATISISLLARRSPARL